MSEMPAWPEWLKEMYAEFAVASVIIMIRIFARTSIVGWIPWRGWKGDDYLIWLAWFCYGGCAAAMYRMLRNPPGMGLTPEMIANATPEMRKSWKIYADMNMMGWYVYLTYLWAMKACLLFFYNRLTMGLWQQKLVKISAWIIGITYIMACLYVLFHCGWPVSKNWVIGPNGQDICNGDWTQYAGPFPLNFLTDVLIFCIPTPLLWRSNIPFRRKLAISFILCAGVLIIVATVLRNTLALLAVLGRRIDVDYIFGWLSRELFVAAFVVNLPCIRPMFTSRFWKNHALRHKFFPNNRRSLIRAGDAPPPVCNCSPSKGPCPHSNDSDESGKMSDKMSEAELGAHAVDCQVNGKPLTYGVIHLPRPSHSSDRLKPRNPYNPLGTSTLDSEGTVNSTVSRPILSRIASGDGETGVTGTGNNVSDGKVQEPIARAV